MESTVLVAINSQFVHTSLSVRQLTAYVKEKTKGIPFFPTLSYAEFTVNVRHEKITADLFSMNARVYAFSVYIFNLQTVLSVAAELKKIRPDALIVMGGPEVSFETESFLRENPFVDGVLLGEGENTLLDLMHLLSDRTNDGARAVLGEIEGFAVIKDGEYRENPRKNAVDMDSLPFPYDDLPSVRERILYYESARGCPYACSYCMSSRERALRVKSLSLVFEDIDRFLAANVRLVKFVDRTFNADEKRAIAIINFIKERDNGYTCFHFELSPVFTDRLIAAVSDARSGLFRFEVGLQSTNERTLRAVGRSFSPEKSIERVKALVDTGRATVHLDMIAGLPYEDMPSIAKTVDDILSVGAEEVQFGFLKMLKGAPIMDQCEHGIKYSPVPPYTVLETAYLSAKDVFFLKNVEELIDRLYNSGSFKYSFSLAGNIFGSYFAFLSALCRFLEKERFFDVSHKPVVYYDVLFRFLTSVCPERRNEILRYVGTDLCLFDKCGAPPQWLEGRIAGSKRHLSNLLRISEAAGETATLKNSLLVSFPTEGGDNDFFFLYGKETKMGSL